MNRPKTRPETATRTIADASEETLTLSPREILAGITFHLADEGIADSVDNDSHQRVLRRLEKARARVEIPHRLWSAFSHRQRLDRLLSRSGTTYRVRPDRTAVLDNRA
jgi:hypothetical protein